MEIDTYGSVGSEKTIPCRQITHGIDYKDSNESNYLINILLKLKFASEDSLFFIIID